MDRRRPARRQRGRLAVGVALLALSCSGPTEPDEYPVMGSIVGYFDDDPQITIPDTVSAGVPFGVTILTYGGGCHEVGPTEVTSDPRGYTVTPFDRALVLGVCTSVLNVMVHSALLSLYEPGAATITFRGFDDLSRDTVEFARSVWVQ